MNRAHQLLSLSLVVVLFGACAATPAVSNPDSGSGGSTADAATEEPRSPDAGAFTLRGAAQKGPFIAGTSISIGELTAGLVPTGRTFHTSTTNNAGEFELEIDLFNPVRIEASGKYYHELRGTEVGDLTLRAIYQPTAAGAQQAYVNLFTHLTRDRVAALVKTGTPFATAVASAETTLVEQLGFTVAGFTLGARGTKLNLTGPSTEDNAFLFAVSVAFASAADRRAAAQGLGGDANAQLQQLINNTALAFASTGLLTDELRLELLQALAAVDLEDVKSKLKRRLIDMGVTMPTVPELGDVLDTDRDGIADSSDVCRFASDSAQLDGDGDGVGDACDNCPQTVCAGSCLPALEVGAPDVCGRRCDLNGPSQCAVGESCLELDALYPWHDSAFDDQGICAAPCDIRNSASCPQGLHCVAGTVGSTSGATSFCLPRPSDVTDVALHGDCSSHPTACASGTVCSEAEYWTYGQALCTTPCVSDADCSTGTTGKCVPFSDVVSVSEPGHCQASNLPLGASCEFEYDYETQTRVYDSCAAGLTCFLGSDINLPYRCVPAVSSCAACTTPGSRCVEKFAAFACVPAQAESEPCSKTAECAAGLVCEGERCQSPCTIGSSCPNASQTCVRTALNKVAVCQTLPAHCTNGVLDADEEEVDCAGEDCARCIDFSRCTYHSDCIADHCEYYSRRCAVECNTTADCAAGRICTGFPGYGTTCQLSNLPLGARCDFDPQCASASCTSATSPWTCE